MDNILLCTNRVPLVTSIYNTFIENYMPSANGSYVKVYLYLAKCLQTGEENLSISSLADRMENTEKDILRALLYWEKKKLLAIRRDSATEEIIGLEMLEPECDVTHTPEDTIKVKEAAATIAAPAQTKVVEMTQTQIRTKDSSEPKHTIAAPATQEASAESAATEEPLAKTAATEQPTGNVTVSVSPQQLKALSSDGDFVWICNVVESYLERPMKPNEIQLISYLYGTLHFSGDLILHLYDYCISMGKTSCNYIQTVALSWHDQGITTPEEAKKASVRYHAAYNAVSKALALGRALADIEKKFVDRWQKEWGMDLGVILEACNRTVLKLHHADFKYTEGILSHWKEDGVHTLQDVEQSDANYAETGGNSQKKGTNATRQTNKTRNQFQNFKQREVSTEDLQELERKLLMQ